MRRQIVAACLLQYIFVGEDGSEERGGRRTTSFHFQPELCSRRGRSFLPAASRGATGRMAEAAAIRFRVHESVDISIIFKCIKARDRSRWRMKKVEAAPTEEKRYEKDGGKDQERKEEVGRKKTEGKERRKDVRERERSREGKGRNE